MKCIDILRDMYAFLDGEVPVQRNLEVLQHIHNCPPCAHRFEAEKRVEAGVRDALREEAPSGLRARLGAALEAEGLEAAAAPAPRGRLLGGRWRFLAAAAAALLLGIVALDYACIGPFQCPLLLASVEAADGYAAGTGIAPGGVVPDLAGQGFETCACRVAVPAPSLGMQACVAEYEGAAGRAALVVFTVGDHAPKPWNRVRREGREWYEAEIDGARLLGWKEGPEFRALVTRSAGIDLRAMAAAARR